MGRLSPLILHKLCTCILDQHYSQKSQSVLSLQRYGFIFKNYFVIALVGVLTRMILGGVNNKIIHERGVSN